MKKIISLILTLIILLIAIYSFAATFSENREYNKVSLDYYLLTPKELSQLSKYCENNPQFVYSSADGPKPSIIHLRCSFEENIIRNYVNKYNFEKISDSQFKRGSLEMEFEKSDTGKVILITVYEYL